MAARISPARSREQVGRGEQGPVLGRRRRPGEQPARGFRPAAELEDGGHPARLPLDRNGQVRAFSRPERPRATGASALCAGRERARPRAQDSSGRRYCGDRHAGGAMLASGRLADLGPRRTMATRTRRESRRRRAGPAPGESRPRRPARRSARSRAAASAGAALDSRRGTTMPPSADSLSGRRTSARHSPAVGTCGWNH